MTDDECLMTKLFTRASFVVSAFGFSSSFHFAASGCSPQLKRRRMTPEGAVSARSYNYAGNTVESVTSLSTVC
jgi:hypothetical protein